MNRKRARGQEEEEKKREGTEGRKYLPKEGDLIRRRDAPKV